MALSQRDVILASIAAFVAWGYAVNWAPNLRWVGYAFTAGLVVPVLGLIVLMLTISRGINYGTRNKMSRPEGLAFLGVAAWKREVAGLRARQVYQKQPLYAASFLVSDALDELLDLIIRDFVKSWYSNISSNPSFTNEVDRAVRIALASFRDRLFAIDLVDIVTMRFVPILTAHFRDFYEAERAVRGKHLNRSVTESEELDLAIAGRYKEGKLHPAASLAYSDTRLVQQDYLRNVAKRILPETLPEKMLASRAVLVLIEEVAACAVLFPIMQMLSDPDTWNQVMEAYASLPIYPLIDKILMINRGVQCFKTDQLYANFAKLSTNMPLQRPNHRGHYHFPGCCLATTNGNSRSSSELSER